MLASIQNIWKNGSFMHVNLRLGLERGQEDFLIEK
jgi:hypothetical protein